MPCAQHIELLFGRSQPPCRFAPNGGQSLHLLDEVAAAALLRLDPRPLRPCRLQGLDGKLGAALDIGQFRQLAADRLASIARAAGQILLDQPTPLVAQPRQADRPGRRTRGA